MGTPDSNEVDPMSSTRHRLCRPTAHLEEGAGTASLTNGRGCNEGGPLVGRSESSDDNFHLLTPSSIDAQVHQTLGSGDLLQDRQVSWLGCTDDEIDKLQRALNCGPNGDRIDMLPGVLVVDDYFDSEAHRSLSEVGSDGLRSPTASSPVSPQPPSQDGWEDPLGTIFCTFRDAANVCTSRARTCHPCPARSSLYGHSAGPSPQRSKEYLEELATPELSIDNVLLAMRLENHMVDCSGCGQCIFGKRLTCNSCVSPPFSLCESCTGKPMHWPDAPLPAHLHASPSHRFAQVLLSPLTCPKGHQVEPGYLESPEDCESCVGPLHNGVQPEGQGPQYRCSDPDCRFALCVGCYWANRTAISDAKSEGFEEAASVDAPAHSRAEACRQEHAFEEEKGSTGECLQKVEEEEPGSTGECLQKVEGSSADQCCDTSVCPHALRCHVLFSSPLCVGHTVKVQIPSATSMLNPSLEARSWGVDFFPNRPFVVSTVHRKGRVGAWNDKQGSMQNLVRQGDALLQISFADITLKVSGQSPVAVLQLIFREYLVRNGGEWPAHSNPPPLVDLFFGGMRSLPQLQIDEEVSMLQNTGCEFVPRAATTENISTLISANECRILYFSFHTSSDQSRRVFLEDVHGKAHVLTSPEFQSLLLQGSGEEREHHISLVFISSCHSFSLGQHIAAAGVRHVVCVRDDVMDSSCRLFARHFFIALGVRRSVQQAFACGVSALTNSPHKYVQDDGYKFALLPEGGDHTEILASGSAQQPAANKPPCMSNSSCQALPAKAEDFVGREVDVYRLLNLLRSDSQGRRLVLLCGETGIGKSTLMAAVGRFVQSRCDLFDEVQWVAASTDRGASLECENSLNELRTRLVGSPRRRALLLVNDLALFFRRPVQQLLSMQTVNVILAVTSSVGILADLDAAAIAAGVKPVRFSLGPLDSLAQAQLFLGRAARELYTSEVLRELPAAGFCSGTPDTVWAARCPADYLSLADSRLIRPHGGNPRRILTAAQGLADTTDVTDTTAEGDLSGGFSCPWGPHRKVRMVLPGGRETCEWLPIGMLMGDVLKERSPHGSYDSIDIFIEGCRVQPDMSLAQFGDQACRDLLLLEFREKA